MTDERDIERIDARLRELEQEQDKLRSQLMEAQLDQWKARIDDLEVQVHLGTLEASDRLDPLVAVLRDRYLDARQQIDQGSTAAGDALKALRDGFEQAIRDIQDAIVSARDRVAR